LADADYMIVNFFQHPLLTVLAFTLSCQVITQQCCQFLTKLFSQIKQKIRPLAKKFGPLRNVLTNANISVFYTLFLYGKGKEKSKISGYEVYFSADILRFLYE
jgi:hypothetical protein